MKLTVFVKTPDGDLHLSEGEVSEFSIKHSARFEAMRFKTIEAARSTAFEYMSEQYPVLYIWDLQEDAQIQRVFL